ncbi:MAG: zeta toxin family protein [Pseudomonadota bacterium]
MFDFFSKVKNSVKEMIFGSELQSSQIDKISKILLPIIGYIKTKEVLQDIKYSADYDEAMSKIRDMFVNILLPLQKEMDFSRTVDSSVILLCGVNGSGKTTAAGKMSYYFKQEFDKNVVLAACDVFRAAAVDQLEFFANKTDSIFVSSEKGNSASVAFKAIDVAIHNKSDYIILDTSGRLQNNKNLMQELKKTYEVAKKKSGNCMNILVLDALLGYNTLDQIRTFSTYLQIDGLIINKVDNIILFSNVLLKIAKEFPDLSVLFVGDGESISDFKKFNVEEFVDMCFSLR